MTRTNTIQKIDFLLNSDTCKKENYSKLVEIRQLLLHMEVLTKKQFDLLVSENIY